MSGANVLENGPIVPFGFDKCTFAAPPVTEAGPDHVNASKSVLESLEPELPILATLTHGFVEAHPSVQHPPRRHATSLAEVAEQMFERRIRARSVAEFRKAKLVDVGVSPPDLGPCVLQRIEKTLKQTRLYAIVRVEKIDALEHRKGGEDKVDAGVARRAQTAVSLVQIIDSVRIGRCELAADVIGLVKRTTIVDHYDRIGKIRLLRQRSVERFDQKTRLAVSGNDNGNPNSSRGARWVAGRLRHQDHEVAARKGVAAVRSAASKEIADDG